ncbi:hypothetical protein BGZ88_007710 [Linnemannia elongata]|nr:hypothetical protein BGZ88_007710 [Linnemannia elongata]
MRFSAIAASAVAFIVATSLNTVVSAQTITAPEQACMTCIQSSALKQSASCDAETMSTFGFIGPGAFEKMTPKQKRCNCLLSIQDDWIKACTFQDTCTDENASYLKKNLINISGDVRCMPFFAPDLANTTTTATKPSVTVGAPVAVPSSTKTPNGSNRGTPLGAACSKFIAGAALAIGFSTTML